MFTQWYEVTVVYRAGGSMTFVTDKFHWERGGGAERVTWGEIKKGSPKPIKFGIDDVAAIWSKEL